MDDHYGNSPAASDYYVGSYPTQQFYAQPYFYEGMPGYYYEGYGAFGYDEATGQPYPEADVKDQPDIPEKPEVHPRSKPRQTDTKDKDTKDEPAQEFRPSSPTPSIPININYEDNSD